MKITRSLLILSFGVLLGIGLLQSRPYLSYLPDLLILFIGVVLGVGLFHARYYFMYLLFPGDAWSIGIYTGSSFANLVSPPNVTNPILTAKDIKGISADFVSDPFMVHEGKWHLFFEIFNRSSKKGEIGLATSNDGFEWNYEKIVLDEPFHLSYPYVFKFNGTYYMVPESCKAYSVRLYQADDFPEKWSLINVLINKPYVDSCIFNHDGKWWIFSCDISRPHLALRLFYSENLSGPFVEHCQSPVAEGKDLARPGGRVLSVDGKIFRYAQDNSGHYGRRLRLFEITTLTTEGYEETEIAILPPLHGSGLGWNADGMHTIDPHPINNNQWIACVDGNKKVYFWPNLIKERYALILNRMSAFGKRRYSTTSPGPSQS